MALSLEALLATDGLETAKLLVSESIAANDDDRSRYGWAQPVFEKTTEKYIADSLANEPPQRIYKINPLAENLTAAGQLLDSAIARQDTIFGIEIAALNAIIDDLMFKETANPQQRIAEANLAAALAQYTPGTDAASNEDIAAMYKFQRSAFEFRSASRSAKGSALNLTERVDFLREQQAETIRSIYERLMSVVLALPSSGLGKPKPLPNWSADIGLDNLRQLAKWIKDAIKSVERALSREQLIDVVFSTATPELNLFIFDPLLGDAFPTPLTEEELVSWVNRDGGATGFRFDFDQELITRVTGLAGYTHFRLISAGVGIVFDEDFDKVKAMVASAADITNENAKRELVRDWRNRLRMGITIIPPSQKGTMFDGSPSKEWKVPELRLFDAVSATMTSDLANMTLIAPSQMLNVNPMGRWSINVQEWARTAQNLQGKMHKKPFGEQIKMTNVVALLFGFRLAYRT